MKYLLDTNVLISLFKNKYGIREAIYHDLIVVTHNVKHFDRIPGLQVTDWEK